jgi:hypothetical protein
MVNFFRATMTGVPRVRTAREAAILLPSLALLGLLGACAAPEVRQPAPPPPVSIVDCRSCHAGNNKAYPLAADVYKYWESSGHGQYLNRPKNRPDCASCHDFAGDAATGHLDGKKNASGPNTYHLVAGYLDPDPKNEWDVQVRFDQYCYATCHLPSGRNDMRHERDDNPAKGAVQMGQHASYEKPLADYPLDGSLKVFKGSDTAPYFALCVSCHDPHGSGADSLTGRSNRMARDNYKRPPRLCSRCHT